jgi:hypothetical protein
MRIFDFRTTPDNTAKFPDERLSDVKTKDGGVQTLQVTEPFQLVTDHGTFNGDRGDVIVVNEAGEARIEKADDLTDKQVADTRTE